MIIPACVTILTILVKQRALGLPKVEKLGKV